MRLNDEKLSRWLAAKTLAVIEKLRSDAALEQCALVAANSSAIGAIARLTRLRALVFLTFVLFWRTVAPTFRQTSDDVAGHVARDFISSGVAFVSEYLSTERADALADQFKCILFCPSPRHSQH